MAQIQALSGVVTAIGGKAVAKDLNGTACTSFTMGFMIDRIIGYYPSKTASRINIEYLLDHAISNGVGGKTEIYESSTWADVAALVTALNA